MITGTANVKMIIDDGTNHCVGMIVNVPDMEAGCCLGSEENGVSVGEGSEGGTRQLERGKDKQSMPNKGKDSMGKTRRNNQVGCDGGGSVRTEQSSLLIKLNFVNMMAEP
jgi:hypothetical protein